MTPEEITYLGSGELRHQWGLGIGPDPCNKLYVMHRAVQGSFENARLVIGFKTNIGKTTSDECHNCGYGPTTTTYSGAKLGVIVVSRSTDGQTLSVRGYDLLGVNLLTSEYHATVPEHWEGDCSISLRGDNCFASGVMTT